MMPAARDDRTRPTSNGVSDRARSGDRDMSRPTVSLVMPNYNHAEFLERSIGAALLQTRPADQIVIVDDASDDRSFELISRLVEGHANVVVLRNAHRQGVLRTLNLALAHADGDFVAFPSADDMLYPRFVEVSAALLEQYPTAAFCCSRAALIDKNDGVSGYRPLLMPATRARFIASAKFRQLLRHGDHFFLGAVTLYRRDMLLANGGFAEQLGSASDGVAQLQLAGRHGFCFVPSVLGAWRLHGENFSSRSVGDPQALDLMLEKCARTLVTSAGDLPKNYAALFERRLRFSAARLLVLGDAPLSVSRLVGITHANRPQRRMLAALASFQPASKFLLVLFLAAWLRPFSFGWLAIEPLRVMWARLMGATQ